MTKNRDQAADLVQQTFCIWAEKGDQLREPSKAKSWLFTTLYREFLALSRLQKKHESDPIEPWIDKISSPSTSSDRHLDAELALQLLSQLDESFRAPLTLFFLRQLSYREIADVLDIPIGTVMSRISRGKELLRADMIHSIDDDSSSKVVLLHPSKPQHGVQYGSR